MTTQAPSGASSGGGSTSGAVAALAALQKKMIKEMTEIQGLEVQFQGQSAPLQTGRSDARNVTGS
jgi:hypothetical protein